MVSNKGKIVLGNEVRVWSSIVQAKLLTGKKGNLLVGDNSRLNGVHIYSGESVIIGKNVRIAPYTIILDSDFHDLNNHFADGATAPIVIHDNVWIATRATLLKGVTIGEGAVVATGAVVTRDVEPYTVVAGVPARKIKTLTPPSRTH
jgi:maltose O-acetyltransferase